MIFHAMMFNLSDCESNDVEYKGVSHKTIPTAIYKAIAVDGSSYRVAVSFISSQGHIASNVSEAIWYWMQQPGGIWYSLQRISPWNPNNFENSNWDHAVIASMDIPTTKPFINPLNTKEKI